MNLVLSSDAKPRLKWTQELHQRFVDAVTQLGGPEKATPKSLMRVMAISGLTLYHLKSHLQKYRLGRSQQSQPCHQSQYEEENEEENQISRRSTDKITIEEQEKMNDLQVAQALEMQMDVQKKLHEQIEVQRHLQLRIEAQGKYLQSVLKRAQDTLSDYSEVEQVKAQLAQLLSMVNSGSCPESRSFSVLTESADDKELLRHKWRYSVESSLTSSDSSSREADISDVNYKRKGSPVVLSLMEMHPTKNSDNNIESDNRKRSKNGDLSNHYFDLNSKCLNESDSGIVDLNCNG